MRIIERPEIFNEETYRELGQVIADRSHWDSPDWWFKLTRDYSEGELSKIFPKEKLKQLIECEANSYVEIDGCLVRVIKSNGLQTHLIFFKEIK